MSTIKSDSEDLTLNAHGSGNDIIFQSNASQVGSLTAEGVMTTTTFAGSGASLTALPAAQVSGTHTSFTSTGIDDNATSTAITINSDEGVDFVTDGSTRTATFTGNGIEVKHATLTSELFLGTQTGSDVIIKSVSATNPMLFYTNSAERMRIDSSGNVKVNTGNLVIGTAGKGIDFSATSDAGGMSSELLDDYEEGTWTPTLPNGGTVSAVSGSSYTKIGRLVHYYCYISISGVTNDSEIFKIGSLPFTSQSGNFHYGGSVGYVGTFDWAGTGSLGAPGTQNGSTTVSFPRHDGSSTSVLNSAVQGITYMILTGTYLTD